MAEVFDIGVCQTLTTLLDQGKSIDNISETVEIFKLNQTLLELCRKYKLPKPSTPDLKNGGVILHVKNTLLKAIQNINAGPKPATEIDTSFDENTSRARRHSFRCSTPARSEAGSDTSFWNKSQTDESDDETDFWDASEVEQDLNTTSEQSDTTIELDDESSVDLDYNLVPEQEVSRRTETSCYNLNNSNASSVIGRSPSTSSLVPPDMSGVDPERNQARKLLESGEEEPKILFEFIQNEKTRLAVEVELGKYTEVTGTKPKPPPKLKEVILPPPKVIRCGPVFIDPEVEEKEKEAEEVKRCLACQKEEPKEEFPFTADERWLLPYILKIEKPDPFERFGVGRRYLPDAELIALHFPVEAAARVRPSRLTQRSYDLFKGSSMTLGPLLQNLFHNEKCPEAFKDVPYTGTASNLKLLFFAARDIEGKHIMLRSGPSRYDSDAFCFMFPREDTILTYLPVRVQISMKDESGKEGFEFTLRCGKQRASIGLFSKYFWPTLCKSSMSEYY